MFNIYIPRDTSQVFLFFLIISHFVAQNQTKPKCKKEEAVALFFWLTKFQSRPLWSRSLAFLVSSPLWLVAEGHFFPGRWFVQ